jgi:hypothetical protein
MSTATSTGTVTRTAARLQERARQLRSQAAALHPLLADAYRRRAAELDLQALLEAVWNPPIDLGGGPPTGPGRPVADPWQLRLAA